MFFCHNKLLPKITVITAAHMKDCACQIAFEMVHYVMDISNPSENGMTNRLKFSYDIGFLASSEKNDISFNRLTFER